MFSPLDSCEGSLFSYSETGSSKESYISRTLKPRRLQLVRMITEVELFSPTNLTLVHMSFSSSSRRKRARNPLWRAIGALFGQPLALSHLSMFSRLLWCVIVEQRPVNFLQIHAVFFEIVHLNEDIRVADIIFWHWNNSTATEALIHFFSFVFFCCFHND